MTEKSEGEENSVALSKRHRWRNQSCTALISKQSESSEENEEGKKAISTKEEELDLLMRSQPKSESCGAAKAAGVMK